MSQISIVKLSELEEDSRFGAECYHPDKIKSINKLKKAFQKKISDFFYIIQKQSRPKKDKVKLLELENMGNFEIKEIPLVDSENIKSNKYLMRNSDVIISRLRPYLKQVGILFEDKVYGTTELNVLRLKENENPKVSFFLYCLLCSDYAQKIFFWSQEGTNHPRFPKYDLENLPFKIPSPKLLDVLYSLKEDSYSKLQKSKSLYKEAEEILLKELNLENYKPKHELTFSSKLSEVLDAERIDADYFQPKYKEIEKKIENYKGGFDYLTDEEINNKNFFPELNKEYNYIELSNVSGNGEINGFTKDLGKNLPTRARRKLKEGDVIISSIEGSLNSCALVTKDYENCLCSNGFFVLKSKKINSETLLVLFKSLIIQKLLERGCKGTILTAISKEELQKIKIPLLSSTIQNKISEKIQESFKLRKESKELLEKAKKMVEDEIEKEAMKS